MMVMEDGAPGGLLFYLEGGLDGWNLHLDQIFEADVGRVGGTGGRGEQAEQQETGCPFTAGRANNEPSRRKGETDSDGGFNCAAKSQVQAAIASRGSRQAGGGIRALPPERRIYPAETVQLDALPDKSGVPTIKVSSLGG